MIYFLKSVKTGFVKIGKTDNYHVRLLALVAQYGELELLGLMDGGLKDEYALHIKFSEFNVKSAAGVEWFVLSDEIANFIRQNTHCHIPDRIPPRKRMTISVKLEAKYANRVREYAFNGCRSVSSLIEFALKQVVK